MHSTDHAGKRNTAEKVRIFRTLFTGLTHVYATYNPLSGHYSQLKAPVTDEVILSHLKGRRPYAFYLLVKDRTRAMVVDFDQDDSWWPTRLLAQAEHYGIPAYIERSKSKGYHVWVFFQQDGVPAAKARIVLTFLLDEIEAPRLEIFPRHDQIGPSVPFSLCVNAPLFGALVPRGRTVFLDPRTLNPFPDQWTSLEGVRYVAEALLDQIIDINQLRAPEINGKTSTEVVPNDPCHTFGLPPCARKMLEGVGASQRVICFRLAVHLRKTGLPADLTLELLKAWASKNSPSDGKGTITAREITAQVSSVFRRGYRGCGLLDPLIRPFCDESCPIRRATNRLPTPCVTSEIQPAS